MSVGFYIGLKSFSFQVSPRSKRRHSKRFIPIELLEHRTLLSAVHWIGPASGGDWETAANWSSNAVPTASDDLTIAANTSINHAAGNADLVHSLTSGAGDTLNLSAGSIALLNASNLVNLDESGGVLIVDAPVSMSGTASQWTGGYVDGGGLAVQGVLTNTGTLTIASGPSKYVLDDGTLKNQGTVIADDNLNLQNGTVNNSGVYDFQNTSPAAVVNGGNAMFNNSGTLKKSAGAAGAAISSVVFNNSAGATIEADASTLTLAGVNGTYGSTNFVANGTAVIDMTGGQTSNTYTGTFSGSGTGQLRLASGEMNVGAAGATFSFAPGFFQWSGGYIGGSSGSVNGVLTNTGTITLVPGSGKYLLQSATLDNQGTVIANDDLNLQNGTVNNTGTYDFRNSANAATIGNGGNAVFNNLPTGILTKSAGAGFGASVSSVIFNNSAGAIIENDVSGTTLQLGGVNGTYGSTNFVAKGTAVIDMTGGQTSNTYTGSFSGSGTGQLKLANGEINIGAAGATLNFAPGFFQWSGGYIGGSGSTVNGVLTNTATMTLVPGSGKYLLQFATLNNQGTIIANDDLNLQNGTLNNAGTYDFQNSLSAAAIGNGGNAVFNNLPTGILKKSAGPGFGVAVNGQFNNSAGAIIENDVPGTTLTLDGTNGTYLGAQFIAKGTAAIDMTGGQTSNTYTGTFSGSGTGHLKLASGELNIGAAGATFNFPPGLFQWSGGYIGGSGGAVNGALTNTGTITLVPGSSKYLLQFATLDNQGTVIADDDLSLQNGTINNDSGGVYDFQNAAAAGVNNGGNAAFNNLLGGTLKKSTGAGAAQIAGGVAINLPGTTEVDASSLTINDNIPQFSGTTLTGGTWIVNGGATLSTPNNTMITTIANGASVSLSGPGSSWPSAASATPTTVMANDGNFNLLNGRSVSAASFASTGGLTLGTGDTASSGSNLTSAGALSQTGTLTDLIGGTPASGEFGNAAASSVTLGGMFTAHLANGFNPVPGDKYAIINNTGASPINGTFTGLAEGAKFQIDGVNFSISYVGGTGNDVVLTVFPRADLAITVNDGSPVAVPGKTTTYTITVTNNGPSPESGATVVDAFPSIITSDTYTAVASAGSSVGSSSGAGNINTTASLLPGGTATFTVVAHIDPNASGTLVDTATVTAPVTVDDLNLSNNTASDTDIVPPAPAVGSFTVNDGSAQRSMVNKLTVAFSTPVTLAANAITLATTGGTAVPFTLSSADGQTYVLTFTASQFIAGSLADGQYVLTVHAAAVTNSYGGPMASDQTESFFRLFGDYDGNGTVNSADYFQFKKAFGTTRGGAGYLAMFDYDGNGTINSSDYFQFKKRFGMKLV